VTGNGNGGAGGARLTNRAFVVSTEKFHHKSTEVTEKSQNLFSNRDIQDIQDKISYL
jgi:hypothetical protein